MNSDGLVLEALADKVYATLHSPVKLAYDFTCEARVFFFNPPVKLAYSFTCEARVFFSDF